MEQLNLFEVLYEKYKIKKPIRLIELFGGIGSQAKALENLHANFEHYKLVEFDKYPVASYNEVHGTHFKPTDITKIHACDLEIKDRNKYEYIMTYSFPCQDLSLAGKGKGMSKGSGTRSGLLWEVERLLTECEELPQILLMENVPQVIGQKNIDDFNEWKRFLEKKGYSNYYEILNAKDYGIPQNRQRCFMVSILGEAYYEFPKPIPLKLKLKDMLEDEVDEKYYLSQKMMEYVTGVNQKESKFPRGERFKETLKNTNVNGIAATINTSAGNRPVDNFVIEGEEMEKPSFDEVYDKLKKSSFVQQSKRIQENDVCDTLLARDYKDPKCVIEGNKALNETLEKNKVEDGDFIDAYNRSVKKDISGTITTRVDASNNTYIAVKNATKKGYLEATEGDGIDISSRMEHHRGTVTATNVGLRIRKLTPKECWRLMGFSDQDFNKAAKVNSNAQLYKQAGNSIVVNVLMAIFSQLL